MSTSMGRPVADLDDFLEHSREPALQEAPEPAAASVEGRSHAVWWIMGTAALLVAAGATYWMLRSATDVRGADTMPEVTIDAPSGVSGFAEMYVATYLTNATGTLGHFLPAGPSTESMTPAAHYVTRTAALDVAPAGDNYWSVLVAADVLILEDDGYHPAGLQYFQVGIVDDGGRLVATSLPARVSGPAPRSAPPRSLQTTQQAPADSQAALVGDFLEALLTSRRDIGRYVSADSGLVAISPAPYTAILMTATALFPDGSVLVTVDAQGGSGAISTLQYTLRLSGQGADLVVVELLAGPPPISSDVRDGS